LPSVSVPVLSKATVVTACATSSASASLIRMPWRAATPVPAMIAVGVARPSAQGQAITSTATALISACSQSPLKASQPKKVSSAMPSTTGTNTALTRSTMRWIGALAAWADSTMRMMRASVVSAPIAPVRTCSTPSLVDRTAGDRSPTALATGRLSPVISDSSTWLRPSMIAVDGHPLARADTTMSPTATCSTGVEISAPSRQHAGDRRAQRVQRADRIGRLPLGARLEPLAQQHQRDDGRRGLEVQVRHAVVGVLEQQVDRQPVGRAGAQRHQQVHVAGSCLHRLPAGAVEARAQPELHRRGQRQLHPAVQASSACRTAAAASAAPAAASAPRPLPRATTQAGGALAWVLRRPPPDWPRSRPCRSPQRA
jgi:hypothetical protein